MFNANCATMYTNSCKNIIKLLTLVNIIATILIIYKYTRIVMTEQKIMFENKKHYQYNTFQNLNAEK